MEAPKENDLKRKPDEITEQPESKKKKIDEDKSSSRSQSREKHPHKDDESKKSTDEKTELYVANMPYTTTENSIEDYFSKYGKIKNVKLLKDKMGRSKGISFVKFDTNAEATKALVANDQEFEGRKLRVNFAGEKPTGREERPSTKFEKGSNQCTIFIGNIPFSSSKDSIEDMFKSCGSIKDVRFAIRDDGKPKGFAHIEFESEDSVEKALKMNGTEMDGRHLKVDIAGNKSGNCII